MCMYHVKVWYMLDCVDVNFNKLVKENAYVLFLCVCANIAAYPLASCNVPLLTYIYNPQLLNSCLLSLSHCLSFPHL